MLDIFSAVTMLSTQTWSNQIFDQCKTTDGCIPIPFQTGKWLFVGCIIFGFLLVSLALLISIGFLPTLLVGIRIQENKENHCQPRYLLCIHQRYGESLLLSSYVYLFSFRLLADSLVSSRLV